MNFVIYEPHTEMGPANEINSNLTFTTNNSVFNKQMSQATFIIKMLSYQC